MKEFQIRLKSLRNERGLSQAAMAKLTGLQRSTLSGYETSGKEPDQNTLCLLADFFDVSTDYLLGHSDERKNIASVFFNDTINFKAHYKAMPVELRPGLGKCFASFYLLLDRDVQLACSERLEIYQELLDTLQSLRVGIRRRIEASGGAVADPVVLSDLMALQSQLKNEVSALLDKLMQADMEIAFNVKRGVGDVSSDKSAM